MPALALLPERRRLDALDAMEASAKVVIRPYRSEDRARVRELVGVDVAASGTGLRVQVAEEVGTARPGESSTVLGAVVYRLPERSDQDAQLGAVSLSVPLRPGSGQAPRWDVFYGLVRATAEDALAAGHATAMFTVKDRRLLDRIERDFTVDPKPAGFTPEAPGLPPRTPVEWLVRVDLADALAQLERVLARLWAS